MTDQTEELPPCARGCTWDTADEDEAPRPKPARSGTTARFKTTKPAGGHAAGETA